MTPLDSRVAILGPRQLAKPSISHQQAAGCCRVPACFLPGDAFGMAVSAFDGVDVMGTLEILECGIHLFHIQPAIRELWMARRARGASLLPMLFVTRQATQALVNAHRSAVIRRLHLSACARGMALVAQSLPLIGADLHQPRALIHLRQRQPADRYIFLLAAVE